jgi:plasmid stabilization system protein ParE
VKFGGFGMKALRADRARISTSPRSRSVASNAFRLIASSETRAGLGNPHMGPARSDIAKELRYHPVGNYLLLYRIISGGIELVRVVHGARDLAFRSLRRFCPQISPGVFEENNGPSYCPMADDRDNCHGHTIKSNRDITRSMMAGGIEAASHNTCSADCQQSIGHRVRNSRFAPWRDRLASSSSVPVCGFLS